MLSKHEQISRRKLLSRAAGLAGVSTLGFAASSTLFSPATVRAAKPNSRIKVGQIGTAHAHARGKAETVRKLNEYYELIGVAESDPERRKDAKEESAYRGVNWISEEKLLATRDLKAVLVETTEAELVPTAMRCIKAGLHVHVDKPPGWSLTAFKKLLDEAQSQRLTVQMGYMFRYNPAFKFCFDAIRKGWLGRVFEVHGVISKTISDKRRKNEVRFPGGSMFILGCHLIDALLAAMGKPDKVTPYVRRTRTPADNLADNMLAVFEYPIATATIRSAFVEVDGSKRRQFVVCGDEGTVDIRPLEPPKLQLALSRARDGFDKGYQQVDLPAMPGRYDEQLIDFAAVVRGEKQPEYLPDHDFAVHKAVLQACELELK